jgi:hypothetical protein
MAMAVVLVLVTLAIPVLVILELPVVAAEAAEAAEVERAVDHLIFLKVVRVSRGDLDLVVVELMVELVVMPMIQAQRRPLLERLDHRVRLEIKTQEILVM